MISLNVSDLTDPGALTQELKKLQGFTYHLLGNPTPVVAIRTPEERYLSWAEPGQYCLFVEVSHTPEEVSEGPWVYMTVVFYLDGRAFATPLNQGSGAELRTYRPVASWADGAEFVVHGLRRYLDDIGDETPLEVTIASDAKQTVCFATAEARDLWLSTQRVVGLRTHKNPWFSGRLTARQAEDLSAMPGVTLHSEVLLAEAEE